MDTPLVSHAHSQCHVIFKASGADSAFYVSEERLPVTDRTAILVNAWEPHYFYSEPDFPRTVADMSSLGRRTESLTVPDGVSALIVWLS